MLLNKANPATTADKASKKISVSISTTRFRFCYRRERSPCTPAPTLPILQIYGKSRTPRTLLPFSFNSLPCIYLVVNLYTAGVNFTTLTTRANFIRHTLKVLVTNLSYSASYSASINNCHASAGLFAFTK